MSLNKKLLVICGPTAMGKTKLGLSLAKEFGGEIIAADSRHAYRWMDIGTGKELPPGARFRAASLLGQKNKKHRLGYYLVDGVRLWLCDIVKPDQRFSVAEYVRFAQKIIKDIWRRKKLPILVGGTGFYIKALTDGIDTLGIPPDWPLRWRLKDRSVAELFNLLSKFNSGRAAAMNVSDRQNPRRLVRAIEIAQRKDRPTPTSPLVIDDLLMIGLKTSFKEIYKRIDQRVKKKGEDGNERGD